MRDGDGVAGDGPAALAVAAVGVAAALKVLGRRGLDDEPEDGVAPRRPMGAGEKIIASVYQ